MTVRGMARGSEAAVRQDEAMAPSPGDAAEVFVCTSVFGVLHGAMDRRVAPCASKPLIFLKTDGADFLVAFLSPSSLSGIVLIGRKVTP